MGYILPIQQHQYADYQRRIMDSKQDPYFIDKPFKVILESQYEELGKIPTKEQLTNSYAQLTINENTSEKMIANITGKGRLFSESI